MNYTIDSLEHVKACLKEEFPEYMINAKPVIYSGQQLTKLKQANKRYFFGVLTVSDEVQAELKYNDDAVLIVQNGSQIIVCFTDVVFKDLENNEVEPQGLFRGFDINIQIP